MTEATKSAKHNEECRFFRLYSIDLRQAARACELLDMRQTRELRECILRDLVVAYARPFSGNTGRSIRKHRVEREIVPLDMFKLHDELITLRNQAVAHTDHDFFDPHVFSFPDDRGIDSTAMILNSPQYEKLYRRRTEIRDLVGCVERRIVERYRTLESGNEAPER